MIHSSTAVLWGGLLVSAGGSVLLAESAQTTSSQPAQQKPKSQQSMQPTQMTLTGCLRQTSDDPNVWALVPSTDKSSATGTTGAASKGTASGSAMTKFPLYRLADKGQKLEGHVGQRIEVTGTVTPAKDEKGADIVTARSENIGVPTTTITTIDLKPAPTLDVVSVRKVAGVCPPKPSDRAPANTAVPAGTSGSAAPVAVSVGAVSENPDRYVGQTVTLTGEVERVFNPRVFSLDEDRVFSAGVDVLVLSKNPGAAKDNQRVTVTGVVRKFVRAELQKEILDLDLRPEWLVDFESRPVVIATAVKVAR